MRAFTYFSILSALTIGLSASALAAKKKSSRAPASVGFSKKLEVHYHRADGGGEYIQVIDKVKSVICAGKRKPGAKSTNLKCVQAE